MTKTTSQLGQHNKRSALQQVKHAAAKPWVERFERFGFAIRGLIYITIGALALQLALGTGGATTNPTSAIAMIGRLPLGKPLLVLIAVGLAGYSLWGLARAILDLLGRGSDLKGIIERLGFLISGLSYAALIIPTVLALMNKPSGRASGNPINLPAGHWLQVAFGLFWIVAAAGQAYAAYTAHFTKDLKTSTMSAEEIKAATWLGRIGFAARAAVFGLIGVFILQSAFAVGAQRARGFDGALAEIARAPYGALLLGAVAIGLILFGAFSGFSAKWNKIGTGRAA